MTANIGFVGLGNMGGPMARNLVEAGHAVKVYDSRPAMIEALVARGASAATKQTVAMDVDAVITMLPAGDDVHDVLLGQGGLVSSAAAGTLFIDSSSIDIVAARKIASHVQAAGMRMVDAPVSGGVVKAKDGTLTFMVGGDESNFNAATPILQDMGEAIIHAGASGAGQTAKICNNMILGISMIAVAEAFALAEKAGLDTRKLQEISSQSSGQCWSMTSYNPMPGLVPTAPANNGYKPGFTSAMMLKDLRLSQSAARDVSANTPLGAEATKIYTQFVDAGHHDMDFSGIIKMITGAD